MSRWLSLRDLPKRPEGECRWCGGPVPARRRRWCGQACVDQYLIRASAAHVRQKVHARDRGVCAKCGLDTDELRRLARLAARKLARWRRRHRAPGNGSWIGSVPLNTPQHGRVTVWLDRTLWEADHIVPVAEGGGACGLDNYRTLCIWCHPRETGQLRRRLNRRKRGQETLPI